jgi:transcriptional regulator with XRE-family HTH domain
MRSTTSHLPTGKIMNKTIQHQALSDDLLEIFEQTPVWTQSDSASLAKAANALDSDPAFQADYLKGMFVEQIQQAMAAEGISQSELARRWGKSRQYLSRVLSEDGRINFTIDTMVELACLVGRKLEQHLLNDSESTHVLRCKVNRSMKPFERSEIPPSFSQDSFSCSPSINFTAKQGYDYESSMSA